MIYHHHHHHHHHHTHHLPNTNHSSWHSPELQDSHIDKSYEWNEWKLRQDAGHLGSWEPVDGRNPAPVEASSLSIYPIIYRVLAPSLAQVVVSDFWTINSITVVLIDIAPPISCCGNVASFSKISWSLQPARIINPPLKFRIPFLKGSLYWSTWVQCKLT